MSDGKRERDKETLMTLFESLNLITQKLGAPMELSGR